MKHNHVAVRDFFFSPNEVIQNKIKGRERWLLMGMSFQSYAQGDLVLIHVFPWMSSCACNLTSCSQLASELSTWRQSCCRRWSFSSQHRRSPSHSLAQLASPTDLFLSPDRHRKPSTLHTHTHTVTLGLLCAQT